MPKAASHDDTKLIKTKKKTRDSPLNLHDYLTTEPKARHTKAQQLEEARRRFLRDNR
jgi:hypothetical protein